MLKSKVTISNHHNNWRVDFMGKAYFISFHILFSDFSTLFSFLIDYGHNFGFKGKKFSSSVFS